MGGKGKMRARRKYRRINLAKNNLNFPNGIWEGGGSGFRIKITISGLAPTVCANTGLTSNTSGAIQAALPLLLVMMVALSQAVPKSQIFRVRPCRCVNLYLRDSV
jgi:hypothetical protein